DEASILAKAGDPEAAYLKVILPRKIQLAKIYAKRASFTYDLAIIGKTIIRLFLANANDAQGI
ncbi:MAG TPA: hypothetical protein VKV05_15025, partial [Terriglobales bacterium]|nr:hypothetical protein [Terriglobales bacterium]